MHPSPQVRVEALVQHTKGNKQLFLEVCCPSVFSAGLINGWIHRRPVGALSALLFTGHIHPPCTSLPALISLTRAYKAAVSASPRAQGRPWGWGRQAPVCSRVLPAGAGARLCTAGLGAPQGSPPTPYTPLSSLGSSTESSRAARGLDALYPLTC